MTYEEAIGVEDHPRVCGEQWARIALRALLTGSPPRVRGTAYRLAKNAGFYRITPACAGNRIIFQARNPYPRDHPRVCGEQSSLISPVSMVQGSPPRVRGTVSTSCTASFLLRITPACAGNSIPKIRLYRRFQDHPRVCGEQRVKRPLSRLERGSPPRVRGTDKIPDCSPNSLGITPACAGNRSLVPPLHGISTDHPRVCGEQSATSTNTTIRIRITPACAGNSVHQDYFSGQCQDHPRVCGEQSFPAIL